jgi:hypothetical protein
MVLSGMSKVYVAEWRSSSSRMKLLTRRLVMYVTETYFMIIGCLICGCRFEMWRNFHNAATRGVRAAYGLYSTPTYTVRGLSGYRSHPVFCVRAYLACSDSQAMSWSEVAAGMCADCTFLMRRNSRPKHAKCLWTWHLYSGRVKCGHSYLRELTHVGWFRIQEFRQDAEKCLWDFAPENCPQIPTERYKISRSNFCLDHNSRNAEIFSQWRLYLNFSSADFLSLAIKSVTFPSTVFVIRTPNIP